MHLANVRINTEIGKDKNSLVHHNFPESKGDIFTWSVFSEQSSKSKRCSIYNEINKFSHFSRWKQ